MVKNSDAHDTTVAAEACVRDARRERMSRAIDAVVDRVTDEAALAGGALAICFWLRELADGSSPPSDVAETSGLVDMFFRHNETLVGQLQKQTSSTKAVLLTHIDSLRADLVAAREREFAVKNQLMEVLRVAHLTDDSRRQLMDALRDGGPKAVMDALRDGGSKAEKKL